MANEWQSGIMCNILMPTPVSGANAIREHRGVCTASKSGSVAAAFHQTMKQVAACRATKSMFTGDHLGYSESVGHMTLFPRYRHGDVDTQVESAKKLLNWDVMHILPGHGRRQHFKDAAHRLQLISVAIDAEKATA